MIDPMCFPMFPHVFIDDNYLSQWPESIVHPMLGPGEVDILVDCPLFSPHVRKEKREER